MIVSLGLQAQYCVTFYLDLLMTVFEESESVILASIYPCDGMQVKLSSVRLECIWSYNINSSCSVPHHTTPTVAPNHKIHTASIALI